MKPGSRIHHVWWLTAENRFSYWLLPMWRPYCWVRGYHEAHGMGAYWAVCIVCWKHLWSRSREGGSNPFWQPNAEQRVPVPKFRKLK